MKTHSIAFSLVLLSVLRLQYACAPNSQYSTPLPLLITEEEVNTMRMVVDSFQRLEARPPGSLLEACSRVTPSYGAHGRPSHCGYWLHRGDTIPLDGWRNPLQFVARDGSISIQSAGADGRFGNG
jgi:hypothetical protein